jgi:DNA invertase Pin-like site-specific DNA recombinase
MQDARAQESALRSFAKQKGIELVKTFSDEDISGSTEFFERPKVSELMEFCERHEIRVILTYDLTRIGRFDEPERIFDVLKMIADRGFIVYFVSEPEIKDPLFRKFWEFLKSWFATYERLMTSQRTKYGLQKLKAEGRLFHRPRLEHYYAAWLHNKELREVGKKEVELARKQLKKLIKKALKDGVKKGSLLRYLEERELKGLYERFPKAPKGYWGLRHLLTD